MNDEKFKKFAMYTNAMSRIALAAGKLPRGWEAMIAMKAKEAVHACASEQVAHELALCFAELASDRDWEPKDGGADSEDGFEFLNRICIHTFKFYADLAFSLWGDRPAQALTLHELANAMHYHVKMDIRNALKPELDAVGILSGKEEDL